MDENGNKRKWYKKELHDGKIFEEFNKIYNKVRWWEWFNVYEINDINLRREAINNIKAINEHTSALLKIIENKGISEEEVVIDCDYSQKTQ